jgi:hypothetical protein
LARAVSLARWGSYSAAQERMTTENGEVAGNFLAMRPHLRKNTRSFAGAA